MSASPAVDTVPDADGYRSFELGFHYRATDGWRRVTSRVAIPASVVTTGDWRRRRTFLLPTTALVTRTSPEAEARRHAVEYGVAGIWRADDSLLVFTRLDDGRISRRTFPRAKPRRVVP